MCDTQKYDFVNAFINNASFPRTIEQLEDVIDIKGCYDIEHLIYEAEEDGCLCWTVPRSSVIGDIVLYFHAKSAIRWISKLENLVKKLDSDVYDKSLYLEWLQRARELYTLYGGKIFAIGRVSSRPEREDDIEFDKYWGSRIYANVEDLYILKNPIDFSEFNSFIYIARQSAITPLPSKEFEVLKSLIKVKNLNIPKWFIESKIGGNKLSKVNQNNFIEITSSYLKRFPLEISFRSYYVDYFLKALAGNNVYMECQCYTVKTPLARVDNIFELDGKKILLEVKLNIALEKDLISQLNKYIFAEYIYLDENKINKITEFERDFMFVIDVYSVYKYDVKAREIVRLFDLDEIKNKEDIKIKVQQYIYFE